MPTPYLKDFKVSQIYKEARHKGIDLVGLNDKTIVSTVKGVVEAVRHDTHPTGGFGLYIRIWEKGTGYYHYFCHLSETLVKIGDEVDIGTPIGKEGSTGHSTGSHLHYEIRKTLSNLTFTDPTPLLGIPNVLATHPELSYRTLYQALVVEHAEMEWLYEEAKEKLEKIAEVLK